MTQIGFPPNPEDGMIFEIIPGLYYIYDASQNCWGRLDGFDSLSPATALADGLMPKEDLVKLNDLLVPPPQASLQGEDCGARFSSGKVALYSLDDSLNIAPTPNVINKVNGEIVGGPQEWSLHRNTAGFDFRVNINQLLQEIESRGILRKVQLQGEQGYQGPKGDPGEDRVDTGPVGPEGEAGANSPFTGTITGETIPLENIDSDANRAIVDLVSEIISDTEYKLVATRANIGNPDACPSLVIPKDFESQLLLSLNTIAGGKLVKNQVIQNSSGDCSLICRICASSIHHLNVEPIIDEIVEQFKKRIKKLKSDKEALVGIWIAGMIELFNQQKAALCCALENCRSRKRNENTKRYVESQRITAAAADLKLQMSSRADDKRKTRMDAFKNCQIDSAQPQAVIVDDDCVTFRLEGKIHTVDPRSGNNVQSLKAYLPAGSYVAEITDCCANYNQSVAGNAFSGHAGILYEANTSIGDAGAVDFRQVIETTAITFPDLGTFNNLSAARNAYQGVTISFEHAGGDVSVWLLDPDGFIENNDGAVTIKITNVDALVSVSTPPSLAFVYVYRNDVSTENFVARIVPFMSGGTVEDFLAIDGEGNVNPGGGIALVESTAQNFFHLGTDGLSFAFVAGAVPGTGGDEAAFTADMKMRFTVDSNDLPISIAAQSPNSNIQQTGSTSFEGNVVVASSSGYAVGELDGLNWSIVFDPLDLDAMRDWLVVDPDDGETLLAQGGTSGIGPQTSDVRDVVSVALFDTEISSGDIDEIKRFGGGNEFAIQSENNVFGQNYTITRPINIEIPVSVPGTTPEEIIVPAPIPEGMIISTPQETPGEIIVPTPNDDPSDVPNDIPVRDGKGSIIIVPGQPSVSEEDSMLPRGTPGSPQDPCILDVNLSISPSSSVSLRYILTDTDGNKYYSAFHTVPPQDVGVFSFISLGMPVQILAPPDIFTDTVIKQKSIEASALTGSLTTSQLKRAERLEGIARLTYVQGLLGTPVSKVPNGRAMTDIEIEYQNAPLGTVIIGVVKALIGVPGSAIEVIIDDFDLTQDGLAQGDNIVLGRIKRIVGTQTGSDSLNNGLLYSNLDSYYGDYSGFDTFRKQAYDFTGNNHFLFNEAGNQRITHLNVSSGFRDISFDNNTVFPTTSGLVSGDSMVVDDHGVVYIADGPAGQVIAYFAANAQILNTTFGDANGQSANAVTVIEDGLPTTDNATIAIGRHFQRGANTNVELICNFGGQWFKIHGLDKVLFANNGAAREDISTPRCCFGVGNPPSSSRTVAIIGPRDPNSKANFGNGSAGNSIASSKPANPQPTLPVPSSRINQFNVEAIQEQLDLEFNNFDLYSLEDNTIYLVNQNNGSRTVFRELGENSFGLKVNPVTKDIYFITNDRGSTPIPSGTRIKRVDVDDIDEETNLPKIKTVYVAEEGEGVFAINFGNTLPPRSDLSVEALYAILSTLQIGGAGASVTARVVEITESPVPPAPGPEADAKTPTNSTWTAFGNGLSVSGVGQNPNRVIFSRIPPNSGCQMHYKQVEWYERGWRIGACCGALIEVGMDNWWIVVKRTIGVDTTCGGGESETTPCVRQFIDSGDGHPAIAWPTTTPPEFNEVGDTPGGGGDEFLGIPTSGFVSFMKDEAMSNTFLGIVNSGLARRIIGNPGVEIPFILFPSL